jgi:hypothetical protein
LPIANSFRPDLVIVSAGFGRFKLSYILNVFAADAATGDPLGGMQITPNGVFGLLVCLTCRRVCFDDQNVVHSGKGKGYFGVGRRVQS